MKPETPTNHVILCGMGQVGWLVLDYLKQTGWPIVVIDDRCDPADARLGGTRLVRGDCRLKIHLEAAGIAQAKALLVLTSADLVNLTCALTAASLRPDLRIVARFFNQNLIGRLGKAVPNLHPVSKSALTAPLFALTALSGETLGAFELAHSRKEIAELRIGAQNPLLGRKLSAIAKENAVAVLALERAGPERERHAAMEPPDPARLSYLQGLDPDATLAEGDRLAVCGSTEDLTKLAAKIHDEGESDLLWASFMRRQGRVVWRTVGEVETPVKVIVVAFLGVLLLSTLLYWLMHPGSFAHSATRVIGLIGTAGELHADQEPEDSMKIFVGFLRVVGIVLTASLTALITNYLVRAKLGGAFAASKIPDSGHLVVCGLGNIGIRVVEELRRQKAPVVVIEKSLQNRFLVEARRLKAAVLIGDACFKDTLVKAHAGRAKAIIAATDDDLVNVEITLLARDLNPRQRVVLRLDDPLLAAALKTAAPIRHAMAVPALAAPAIVAALYEERIHCLFTCRTQLMAIVEIVLDPALEPHWIGQTVRAAAFDFRFVAVDLVADGQPLPMAELNSHRLAAGDRLTVAVAMADLARFLRHEAAARNCAVDVADFAPPMKDWLAQLYRTLNGTEGAAAFAAVEKLPCRLQAGLTRGQAEELLGQLRRERIAGALMTE